MGASSVSKAAPVSSCPLASRESAPRWVSEDRQQVLDALQAAPGPPPPFPPPTHTHTRLHLMLT